MLRLVVKQIFIYYNKNVDVHQFASCNTYLETNIKHTW